MDNKLKFPTNLPWVACHLPDFLDGDKTKCGFLWNSWMRWQNIAKVINCCKGKAKRNYEYFSIVLMIMAGGYPVSKKFGGSFYRGSIEVQAALTFRCAKWNTEYEVKHKLCISLGNNICDALTETCYAIYPGSQDNWRWIGASVYKSPDYHQSQKIRNINMLL